MPDTTLIKLTAPVLTATIAQTDSRINEVTTATVEQTEDTKLNRIADENEGRKRVKVSLNDL